MQRHHTTALLAVLAALHAAPADAQWIASRADSHAPIGVMADHRHEAGEIMLSYRFMYMSMEGSRDGTDAIADADIIAPSGYGFMVTPERMPMQMHMLGAMFAPSERITLMGMFPYIASDMDHITRAGGEFTTESSGVGDLRVGAMIGLADFGNQTIHVNAMVSLPTGSIEQQDVLPTSNGQEVQLPYPMQLGSGTVDLLPGITWLGQVGEWSWGAQAGGTLRLGENERDWSLGDRVSGTVWGARNLSRNVSASLRLAGESWADVEGEDAAPSVNPAVVPTARPDLRDGQRLDLGIGLNLYFPPLSAFRIAAEALLPVYQHLDGPQLETDLTFVLGLQLVPVH